MQATPRFPEDILAEGRLVAGDKVLFPNIAPYDALGAVAILGSEHYLPMAAIEPERIAAGIALACKFFEKTREIGHPESVYHLISWNYMPPSGSSLIHPHLQVYSTASAPNLMREELEAAQDYMVCYGRTTGWSARHIATENVASTPILRYQCRQYNAILLSGPASVRGQATASHVFAGRRKKEYKRGRNILDPCEAE